MKVILADDESLIRSSLISMLGELDTPIEVVGEARNGEELMRLVAEHPPDLAFVDIRMPKLNGLDAIAQVKDDAPGTHWILLTGFSDFEYAKKALRLGAMNYLLKPVSPAQLAEAVNEAGDRCRRYYEDENRRFEHLLLALIHGDSPDDNDALRAIEGNLRGYEFLAAVNPVDLPGAAASAREPFADIVRNALASLPICRDIRFAAAVLPSGECAHVLAWDPRPQSSGETIRAAFQRRIEYELAAAFADGLQPASVLQTGVCASMPELISQLETLQRLAPIRSAAQLGAVATLADLQQADRDGRLLALGIQAELLSVAFGERDFLQAAKELKRFKELFATDLFRNEETVRALSAFLRWTIAFEPGEARYSEREAWFAELLAHGERSLAKRSGEERTQVDWVEQVIRYVDRHYMDDIGIGQIALELNVTPNYLSSLFHKKKGVTFVKYLTGIRMLKAKELLLANPALKVQTIAEQVGYHSARHFTKTFTEQFGCYPSELRDQYK